jgi:dTDP-4-dehydrorhamnose reductase
VLVTGASGLLGRQVFSLLTEGGWQVRGLCSTRPRLGLVRCDLTKAGEAERQIADFCPDIVIHLVAERRPDVCHKKAHDAEVLNVDVTSSIAKACSKFGCWMIFLSTDYVFDGKSPPYSVDAITNPLSEYGMQKIKGEQVTLQEAPGAAVVRVPLLYGQLDYMKESGVTAMYTDLKSGALTKADHTQKRYPTYTKDLAMIIVKMLERHSEGKKLQGIYQWQSDECLTKYDMVQLIAQITNLDASSVIASTAVSKFPVPQDTRMDCSKLILDLGIDPAHFRTPISSALSETFRLNAAHECGEDAVPQETHAEIRHTAQDPDVAAIKERSTKFHRTVRAPAGYTIVTKETANAGTKTCSLVLQDSSLDSALEEETIEDPSRCRRFSHPCFVVAS